MTIYLKQSTASQELLLGPFLDDTDGKTAETALSIANTDIILWKSGGTTTAAKNSGGATHISSGRYYAVMDATDTDTLGSMEIHVHVAGALPIKKECVVLAANIYDSLIGGGDLLQIDVTQLLGTAWLAPGTAGTPDVNVKLWNGLTTVALPLVPTTAGRTLDVSVGGEAGIDWSNIGSPTTAVNLSGTNIDVDQVVASVSGAVGSVSGAVGSVTGNVTGSVGSVATGGITRASLAADTGLQSVRSNTAQAGAATTITLDASASATDDIYNNHVVYLTGGTGAGQARFVSDYNGTTKVATVTTWTTNPDNTSTFAILPFDAMPGASAPTAAQVADAVWDELLSGHAVSGSTGEALSAAGSAGDPWLTALPGAYGSGTAGKIIGDNINATISSRATQTSVDAVDDFLDTEVAAIKAKTDNLPSDPADASDIAASFTSLNTKIDTIDDFLDTEIAAIKAKTDGLPSDPADASDIAAAVAAIQSDTNDIQTRLPAALVDGKMDSTNSDTVVRGTVGTGSTTTSIVTSAFSPSGAVVDQYKGRIVVFDNNTTTAALRGQATDITASSNAATPVLTVTALTTAPASTDSFSVL